MYSALTVTLTAFGLAVGVNAAQAADQVIRHPAVLATTITTLGPNTGSIAANAIEVGGLNAAAASYVVLDFSIGRPAVPVVEITSVTLELSHVEGDMRTAGTLNTYFPIETINPSSLIFDSASQDGIGGQFDVSPQLSSIAYEPLAGAVKEKAIQDLEAVKDGIRDYYLDDPEQFKMVIVPGNLEVAALFAGASDPATTPTLVVEYIGVPEPASAALLLTAASVALLCCGRSAPRKKQGDGTTRTNA